VTSNLQAEEITASTSYDEDLKNINTLFSKGSYLQTINLLSKVERKPDMDSSQKGMIFYWKGIAYNKLQKFDLASQEFTKAIGLKYKAKDIYYEYGQSLYAQNELEKAKGAFRKSAAMKFKINSSFYYVGSIEQTMEQYAQAVKSYRKVAPNDREVAQPAAFQIAEILLIQAKKKTQTKQIVQEFVIPQFDLALKIDPTSKMVSEIKKRRQDLLDEFDLDDQKLVNGRRLPEKRTSLKFQETLSFDSNVITEADEAPSKATPENKASYLAKSVFQFNHTLSLLRRFVFIPEMKVTHDYYFSNNAPNIYKNNQYSLIPRAEIKWEHSLFSAPATLVSESDFTYQAKDVRQTKTLSFYGRTWTFALGEKFQIFPFGETNLKIKEKIFYGQLQTSESKTHSISLTQNFSLPAGHLLLFLGSMDLTRLQYDKTSETNSYTFRFDYIIPDWKGYRPSAAFSWTILDTMLQKDSRGIENTYAPSVAIAKNFGDYHELALKYDFTKNSSKAKTTNAYTKHVYSLDYQLKL
jgi:tetratricopeptide (TPR) repeat protein